MKASSFLREIEMMDARIETRLEELESLKALATRTTTAMDGERVKSSSNQQKMADCVGKIVDAMNEINCDIDNYVDYKREALRIINEACEPDCITLLYKRYFQYKSWEVIACEMRYTYKWVSGGLHNKALNQMQKVLDRKGMVS